MKKSLTKMLSLILALAMMTSIFCVTSFAATTTTTVVTDDFNSYDLEASAASSLTTGGGRYIAKTNGTDATTWYASSSGFGATAAHAGITASPTDSADKVLAIESRSLYNAWNQKPRVIYQNLDVNNTDTYTYKFDFYKGETTAGGGIIVNFDGGNSTAAASANYYAIDFVGRNDHAYGYPDSNVYSTVVIKNGAHMTDAVINTDPETTLLSRTAHDYIPAKAWYTMELTVTGGSLSWTVKLTSTGATVQTGSWTDSTPITGTDLSFALFAGGQQGQYMYFDNLTVTKTTAGDAVTEPTYSVENATLTVKFSPEAIDGIEEMEKLQIVVANYESGTNKLSGIEIREVTDLTDYISEDFAYSGAEGYTKIYIWNGDVADALPAYQSIRVESINSDEEIEFLDYIESTGTQYIDTGFYPNQDSSMVLDFQPTIAQSTCFAGCRTSGTSNAFTINSGSVNTKQYAAMGSSGNKTIADFSTDRKTVSINKEEFAIDGTATTIGADVVGDFTAPYSVHLFACGSSSVTLKSTCRIYSCKIYDNGALVRDFVPCKTRDGEIGMWDNVSDTFYGNDGTGVFIAG